MKFRYRIDGGSWVEADETPPFTIPNTGLENAVEVQAIGTMVSVGREGIAPAITTAGSLDNSAPAPGETVTYTPPTFSGVPAPTVIYSWLLGATDVSAQVEDNGNGTFRYAIPGGTGNGTILTVVASASGFGSSLSTQVGATVVVKKTAFTAFSASPDPVWPDRVEIDGTVPVLSNPFTDFDWQFSTDPDFGTVDASGGVGSLPVAVDLSALAGNMVYFRIRGRNAGVTGDWPATPAGPYILPQEPSQPIFSGDPSISPTTGPVGTKFTIALGEAIGVPNEITYTPTLTLDGVDATGDLNGFEYFPKRAGTVQLVVRASNGIGEDAESTPATATVLAVATAPGQFSASDWDLLDAVSDGELVVRINALPHDGGAPVFELRHDIDGSGDHLLTGTPGAGDYTISGLENNKQIAIRVWAVNAVGAGTPSAAEAVTPTRQASPLAYPDFGIILDHSATATGTVLGGAIGGTPPYVITHVGGAATAEPVPEEPVPGVPVPEEPVPEQPAPVQPVPVQPVPGKLKATGDTSSGDAGDAQELTVKTTGATGTVEATRIAI